MEIKERFAERARDKSPSPIRELLKYMTIEGMISLGGGYPNPDTFAFEAIDISFRSGQSVHIEGKSLITAS